MAQATAPRRDPNYRWLPSSAGVAMEPGEIARWRARLGPGWEVIPRSRFGSRYGLAGAFRGSSRPDMVAVHHGRRMVLVGDVTSRPDPTHLQKTIGYARRLASRMDPSLRGYSVLAQDWYWALPPEYGRRSWPTSRRIVVAAGGRGAREAELALLEALPELAPEAMTLSPAFRVFVKRRDPLRFSASPKPLNVSRRPRLLNSLYRTVSRPLPKKPVKPGVWVRGDVADALRWAQALFPGWSVTKVEQHGKGQPHLHVKDPSVANVDAARSGHIFFGPTIPGEFHGTP